MRDVDRIWRARCVESSGLVQGYLNQSSSNIADEFG
jgi:hypothetical protein